MRRDPVLVTLTAALVLALLFLPIASHAPNRLATGISVWALDLPFLMVLPVLIGTIGLCAAAAGAPKQRRATVVVVGAAVVIGGLVWALGQDATSFAGTAPTPAARASAGIGAWLAGAAALLAVARVSGGSRGHAFLLGLCAVTPAALVIAAGGADETALAREFATARDVFLAACARHLVIVGATMAAAVPLGLSLGVAASRGGPVARKTILPTLGLLQTIPALALFGLLLPIVGVGLLPAVIALTLYALLPVARATASGLSGVPAATRDAARGLGLSAWQAFRDVEVPLAWRVALSGVRVAAVQAVGLAVLASLIGAGGLGTVVFQGLFANAIDTVVLGVAPLVLFATVIDGAFASAGA